jgi:hypothetical protein
VILSANDVSAVIVTRGDVDLRPILDTLPYEDVVVWDNSKFPSDSKVLGRYMGMHVGRNRVCYLQDDDVIFTEHERLLAAYEDDKIVANMDRPWIEAGNYHHLAMVGAGSLVSREIPWLSLQRYQQQYPCDDLFKYECDFIVGTLTPHKIVDLGYEVRSDIFRDGTNRLCDQPWQEEWKWRAIRRAQSIRFFAPFTNDCGPDCAAFRQKWREWWNTKMVGFPVAILDCRPGYMDRLDDKGRNMVRKATRNYVCRRFDYNAELAGIDEVNASKPERQGKPMSGWYAEPAQPTLPMSLCPRHRDLWFGAFFPDGNLAAYCHLELVGDLAIINSILGHAEAPAAVNGLIAYMTTWMLHEGGTWINYLHMTDNSLGAFKRSVGFEEVWFD